MSKHKDFGGGENAQVDAKENVTAVIIHQDGTKNIISTKKVPFYKRWFR